MRFAVALGSRRVVRAGVTRHPTDAWVPQQLREATPEGRAPRYLLRDDDSTYGPAFARVADGGGIAVLRTAYRAPRMNATCERFLGSVRRECLDHLLILGEHHLRRAVQEYVGYFNQVRPHQGIGQQRPAPAGPAGVAGGLCRLSLSWAAYTTPTSARRRPRPGRTDVPDGQTTGWARVAQAGVTGRFACCGAETRVLGPHGLAGEGVARARQRVVLRTMLLTDLHAGAPCAYDGAAER